VFENSKKYLWRSAYFPGGILKTWSSTQASVAQSSGEAEYYALVRAASEALGLQSIMKDLGWEAKIRLLVDSSAAKSIASRTGLGKLRHLEIKFLWLQEIVRRKKIVLSKVRGDINPADVLTKPKSLEDMKQLLNFSCIDWCDGESANSTCNNNFEFVNNVGRSIFVHNRMVHPRGGVGNRVSYSGSQCQGPNVRRGQHVGSKRHVESGRVWRVVGQTYNRTFGSSDDLWSFSRKDNCCLNCCHLY